ncbi:MAG: hypothetical protein ACD_9C00299G0001 [uncultured bacterium]|nr:MAG: hypothetical protein ACD_9C00299G0001 [uncultured bacterium]KKQ46453.1 MAG: Glyoxalase [Candidatus Moranbacteria bacterium GW2011_GWC2_37_8]KKQ63072.1 MAG: Glyoxalase [Parcubacteria group bacterium GW2011_GWC1_38_22]KKQ79725.1 MAG: Glyoxalase [Candidatus Moranbacteria bacterium GW2011_GWD2_38_7]
MNTVIHFEIQADDIERAKKFYEKALGWKISQMMKKEEGGMDYWGIETKKPGEPGINGGLYKRSGKEDEKFYLYDCTIAVDDLEKSMEAVKTNGGAITKEKSEIPGVGWFAMAKDTEGNRFGLMQPTDWKPE